MTVALENSRDMDQFLASVEKKAFRMAQISTSSTEDAFDIVQDAMLGLVRKYGRRPKDEWNPLFFKILVSRIRDWHRRRKVRFRWRIWLRPSDPHDTTDPLETLPDTGATDPARQAELGDSVAALDAALRALPLRQQQAFLLRAWEGLDVRQTARAMKCSAGSVKTHYSRALHALRRQLKDYSP